MSTVTIQSPSIRSVSQHQSQHISRHFVDPSEILLLDADDPIFPRLVTRTGSRYQAVVPTWEEQLEIEKERARNPPDENRELR